MNSEGVLGALFSFVGKGHFLYVAGVSRSWRRHYTPKTRDDNGELVTSWHDALATVETLEYAFTNGLAFCDAFHPTKDDFGPGVYEWARRHGYPLYVWVAVDIQHEYDSAKTSIAGVFSGVRKAKAEVLVPYAGSIEEDWKRLDRDSSEIHIICGTRSHYITLRAFAVKGLRYTDEMEPLPLYLTSKSDARVVDRIDGVFATKELAEKSIQKIVAQYEGGVQNYGPYYFECYGRQQGRRPYRGSYKIHWECYLDGDGGEPGAFFETRKSLKRKHEIA